MARKLTSFWRNMERKNQMLEYSDDVKQYLVVRREDFLNDWAKACEKNSGRISYEEMENILGKNYPKAKWILEEDKRAQISAFFKELNIPFRSDETHLYFP